jgi:hypothetical protein
MRINILTKNRLAGAILLSPILTYALSCASAQSWSTTGLQGDWAGRDRACSVGSTPLPEQCKIEHSGQVAVCWTDRRTGECGNAAAWCTYKTIGRMTPQDGGNPGQVYQCGALAPMGQGRSARGPQVGPRPGGIPRLGDPVDPDASRSPPPPVTLVKLDGAPIAYHSWLTLSCSANWQQRCESVERFEIPESPSQDFFMDCRAFAA